MSICRYCRDGDPSHKKDSIWAWFVCLCAGTNLAFTVGLIYSFGVLLPVFMDHFKESREHTAWIGSLSIAVTMFFGPFAGSLINRFGCRAVSMVGCLTCGLSLTVASFADRLTVLYVTYAVLGVGGNLVFLSSVVFVKKCFDKHQSVALGLASAGQGLGTMVLSQVLQSLVTAVRWRNTLRIVAGFLFLNSFFGILYDSEIETKSNSEGCPDEEAGQRRTSKRFTFHCSIWKVPGYFVVVGTSFVMMFGRTSVYVLLVKFSEDLGVSSEASSRLILYLGINIVIGRFVCGIICSFKRLNKWYIVQGVLLVNGVWTLLLTLAQNYGALVAYAVVFGFCDGTMATVFNILALTCVDESKAASAFGLALMISSVSAVVGPPISGLTVDKLGSYGPAFFMCGGSLVTASLIPCALRCFKTTETTDGEAVPSTNEENTVQELDHRSRSNQLPSNERLKRTLQSDDKTPIEVDHKFYFSTV